MSKWIRQPQEQSGTYPFSGKFLVTIGIQNLLSKEEIFAIYFDVQKLVKEKDGIDYLVVYIHETTNQKLFFIDQLNREMIASGDYLAEYDYCTLLLAEEYWLLKWLQLFCSFFSKKKQNRVTTVLSRSLTNFFLLYLNQESELVIFFNVVDTFLGIMFKIFAV